MTVLRQSTAVDVLIGPFVDLTNGYTAEEAETPAVLLSKNGQALAAKNDADVPTHDDAGYYNCELDATDTDTVGTLVLVVEATASALPVRHEFQVLEEAVYDMLYKASAIGYIADQPVDATKISGSATAANNVEIVFDTDFATGYDTTLDMFNVNLVKLLGDTPESATEVNADVTKVSGSSAAADALELFALAVDQVTGQIDAGTLHDDTITSGSIATGALTADAFAADAIEAAAIKADAVTKIQNGLATPTNITAGTITTVTTTTNLTNLPAAAATAAELAKVPKSDSNVSWNATALAAINAEVDTALNTAIPGSPTANSVNERIATMDGLLLGTIQAGTHVAQSGDSYAIINGDHGCVSIQDDIDTVLTRLVGTILAGNHTAQTGDSYALIGVAGAGLTALATAAALTTVDNEIAAIDTLVRDIPTNAEFALRTLATAEYATAADLTTAYTLLTYMAPVLIGTIDDAGTGTETFVYGGVTVVYTVDEDGNRSEVAIS